MKEEYLHRLIVQVGGMRDESNINAVAELGIDMIGFDFYEKSPRYVTQILSRAGIIPDYSKERLSQLVRDSQQKRHTRMPKRVGVFVDDMPQSIVTRIYNFNLDFVQLNGDETPVMIENLKRTLIPDIAPNIRIIKTLPVKCVENLKATEQFEGLVDYFLFDLNGVGEGADNMQFAQSLLDSYRGNVPFLLSGGIGPDDTERIKNFNQPMFAGVEVNSSFEIAPGLKDVGKLKQFVDALRKG